MTPSQIKIICKDKPDKNGLKINNFSLLKISNKKLILFTFIFASLSFVPNADAFLGSGCNGTVDISVA
jgi:hypothetical protein